jgi:MATE family multidrug resistance protein
MTNLFMAKSSELGSDLLAANAILFQIQYIVACFFDGLANASSVFAGNCLGRRDLGGFRRTRTITDVYLSGLSIAAAAVLLAFKGPIIQCFTDLEEVVALCSTYMIWLFFILFSTCRSVVLFICMKAMEQRIFLSE